MIGSCVQKGYYVYVYDEKGYSLFSKYGTLVGYTGNTVSVKNNNYVETFDEKGYRISQQWT